MAMMMTVPPHVGVSLRNDDCQCRKRDNDEK